MAQEEDIFAKTEGLHEVTISMRNDTVLKMIDENKNILK